MKVNEGKERERGGRKGEERKKRKERGRKKREKKERKKGKKSSSSRARWCGFLLGVLVITDLKPPASCNNQHPQ